MEGLSKELFVEENNDDEISIKDLHHPDIFFFNDDDEKCINPMLSASYYKCDKQLRFYSSFNDIITEIFKNAKSTFKKFKIFENGYDESDLSRRIVYDEDCGGSWVEIYGISEEQALNFLNPFYKHLIEKKWIIYTD